MNRSIPCFLWLPVVLIVLGVAGPLTFSMQIASLTWLCNLWYIALSLIASEAVIRTLFVRPRDHAYAEHKNHHLQYVLRHIMLGLILLVCNWHIDLVSPGDAAFYLSMRLGITFLLLGIVVVQIAHNRMKAL